LTKRRRWLSSHPHGSKKDDDKKDDDYEKKDDKDDDKEFDNKGTRSPFSSFVPFR
jgi:hypothetical protein